MSDVENKPKPPESEPPKPESETRKEGSAVAAQPPDKDSRWWDRFRLGRGPKTTGPTTPEEVDRERARAQTAARWTDVGLRRALGYGALFILFLQLVVADVAFFIYGYHKGWEIPPEVIDVWLAAAVVQAWILVRVIANYLFPGSGSPPAS